MLTFIYLFIFLGYADMLLIIVYLLAFYVRNQYVILKKFSLYHAFKASYRKLSFLDGPFRINVFMLTLCQETQERRIYHYILRRKRNVKMHPTQKLLAFAMP